MGLSIWFFLRETLNLCTQHELEWRPVQLVDHLSLNIRILDHILPILNLCQRWFSYIPKLLWSRFLKEKHYRLDFFQVFIRSERRQAYWSRSILMSVLSSHIWKGEKVHVLISNHSLNSKIRISFRKMIKLKSISRCLSLNPLQDPFPFLQIEASQVIMNTTVFGLNQGPQSNKLQYGLHKPYY